MESWSLIGRQETELVVQAQAGDLAAFDALVTRYRPGALVLARHVSGSHDIAQDAVQDAFLAAYKALPQLGDAEKFPAWFGAIVRHRAKRIASGERNERLPLDDVILLHAPSIVLEIELRARSEAVRCAVSRLPEEIRPIVELYYIEDWDVRQIAGFMALPATTVKWRLHSGRNLLRASLTDRNEEIL